MYLPILSAPEYQSVADALQIYANSNAFRPVAIADINAYCAGAGLPVVGNLAFEYFTYSSN